MPWPSIPTLGFLLWTALSIAGWGADRAFVFGVIAKSNNNPFFQPARFGAEDEAKRIGQRDGVDVKVDWRTPDQEDAAKQATAMDQLVGSGVSGIAISCSEATSSPMPSTGPLTPVCRWSLSTQTPRAASAWRGLASTTTSAAKR